MARESSEDIVSQRPVLILFQQLRLATVLKAQGVSNDAPTGGGARDLRLRPYDRFQPFMERLLPETRTQSRQDGGEVTIRYGLATWGDGSETREIKYWPPTNARPREGRIAQISSLLPLAVPPEDVEGSVILFVRDEDGLIWVRYATDEGLRDSLPEVGDSIRDCLGNATENRIATGYIDLTPNGLGPYCNAVPLGDDS